MDRVAAMRLLVAAVDAGSLSGASRALGMPLPTVSRKVAELERTLGTQLLARGSRRLTLTESGAAYVAACRHILEQIVEAERAASGEYTAPTGELVVTATQVLGTSHVLPIVLDFLRAYPEIRVRFLQADRSVNLVEERVDVAVRLGAPRDSQLVAIAVGSVRRLMCASTAYLARHGRPREVQDLAHHDCIVFERMGSAGRWDFGHGWLPYTGPVRHRIMVSSADASLQAARAGFGIAHLLSYQVGAALAEHELECVLEAHAPAPLPVNLLYALHKPLPLKIRTFLDFAAPRLRAVLAS